MANLSRDDRGWRVLASIGETRKTIRLGSGVNEAQARTAADHIAALVAAQRIGSAPNTRTVTWLSTIGDGLYARLVSLKLAEPRANTTATLGVLLDTFNQTVKVSPGTVAAYKQGLDSLADYFGPDKALASITPLDADRWRQALVDEKLAPATVSKRVQTARNLFRKAVRWSMIPASPFGELRAGRQDNPARQRFIDRPTIARVLDSCPDVEWRLIVALSRYAGLRCPSEHLGLLWTEWNVERSALTVRAVKTNTVRHVPVGPELAKLLHEAFDAAPPGATHVITRYRLRNANLRTHLRRIIRRAGVDPWPRLFHNLRASCQSEWAERFPLASVCRWLGNTPAVAARHYLTARDEAFDRAVVGVAPVGSVATITGSRAVASPVAQNAREAGGTEGMSFGVGCRNTRCFPVDSEMFPLARKEKVGAGGFEPP